MNQDKRFVYVLRSDRNPRRHYVGLTSDVQTRLDWHNAGQNEHTFAIDRGTCSCHWNSEPLKPLASSSAT
jgi:predicted GIY-YIG superfamily endonuclease